ncbi:MAG: c-type cytochrome [Planctomycetota bacterium]|nr:c-type cytochrome [Planctomycetota bacterium]
MWSVPRFATAVLITATCVGTSFNAAAAPVVTGFERFHGQPHLDAVTAGRMLVGELNCASCHKTDSVNVIKPKTAPVLTTVGSRVTVDFLRKYLLDPHAVKPGATMPDVFAGKPVDEKRRAVEALVHFLASTGVLVQTPPDGGAVNRGDKLFHEIGCVACHGSRKPKAEALATSVPLGQPDAKYSINSLTQFLKDPHQVRPSGRMPSLLLNDKEAADLAHYFLKDIDVEPNVRFKYYEGSWQKLPDFSALKPKSEGGAVGINVAPAARKEQFGLRFEGFLQIAQDGEYTFFLGSDDGSRLTINGQEVVNADGVHPHQVKAGKLTLTKGAHAFVVDYFEQGGDESLSLEFQGPGLGRQNVAGIVTSTRVPPQPKAGLKLDEKLIADGRVLFQSAGCAACHQLDLGKARLASTSTAKPLHELKQTGGCLAEKPSGVPNYSLNAQQRKALAAVVGEIADSIPPSPQQIVAQTMTTLNCYACHARDKIGGPEEKRNSLFLTSIQEMGDEGRIPPALDGVGDKLNAAWLKHVMQNGAQDRPYMLTRMPKFGEANVGGIIDALAKVDLKTKAETVEFDEPVHRVKSIARNMVGDKALSCIKCHYFDKYASTGLQAMDLTKMTTRLRQDWFQRYMLNPGAYRPGTRMPSAWPRGRSILPKVMDGHSLKQIAAIWLYLEDGTKARTPSGLQTGQVIELQPEDRPIIYRNFIGDTSPRGIAVGYPELANLTFDAERMGLSLIWQNQFINAGKHWIGRGPGNQGPLGDNIVRLEPTAPLAFLESLTADWPSLPGRQRGFKFRGYRIDKDGRPTFRYTIGEFDVEDFPKPISGKFPSFVRTITVTGKTLPENLWFRAGVGTKVVPLDQNWIEIDGAIRIRIRSESLNELKLRQSKGKTEVLIPVVLKNGRATIVQEIAW